MPATDDGFEIAEADLAGILGGAGDGEAALDQEQERRQHQRAEDDDKENREDRLLAGREPRPAAAAGVGRRDVADMRQISRRGQRRTSQCSYAALLHVMARLGAIRHAAAGGGVAPGLSSVRPREKRGPRAKHSRISKFWVPASAGTNGECLLGPHSHIRFKQLVGLRGCLQTKENRPMYTPVGQWVALTFFRLPRSRGGGRADRRSARDCSGRVSGLLRTDGREASRPAPCGAPTRHLGLYAFDRGRTGPGHSAPRGCPSTARGRGCVLHRSQVPLPFPAYRTPPEGAPRRVDRDRRSIDMLLVKSSTISLVVNGSVGARAKHQLAQATASLTFGYDIDYSAD